MNATTTEPRLLTPAEVAAIVKAMRGQMTWSQELLAEFAGVTPRTVQRLEAGQPSSTSTRRDVAAAFGWPQDFFDVPRVIPTEADLAAQQAAYNLEYLVLDAVPVDGRGVITRLVEASGNRAMMPCSLAQLPRDVQDAFAAVADYVHDCLDAICDATMADALMYGDELTELTVPLLEAGYSLHLGVRQTSVSNPAWADPTPMPLTVLYVVAAPDGHSMAHIAVKRRIAM